MDRQLSAHFPTCPSVSLRCLAFKAAGENRTSLKVKSNYLSLLRMRNYVSSTPRPVRIAIAWTSPHRE